MVVASPLILLEAKIAVVMHTQYAPTTSRNLNIIGEYAAILCAAQTWDGVVKWGTYLSGQVSRKSALITQYEAFVAEHYNAWVFILLVKCASTYVVVQQG